jgi:hypothetical protein
MEMHQDSEMGPLEVEADQNEEGSFEEPNEQPEPAGNVADTNR